MAIAQDAFYIPYDIATGLATGQYRRIGSVVRYAVGSNKGQIVAQKRFNLFSTTKRESALQQLEQL